MTGQWQIYFDNFRLDVKNETFWQGGEVVALRPKAFMLLRYLVERPGQLVTKKEILDALWPDCHVGDCVLKQCVSEIRKILGDEANMPRFVETAHRRGYRFIGRITNAGTGISEQWPNGDKERKQEPNLRDSLLVGRDSELAFLQHSMESALAGARQVVFITGEQGIGKTSLVNTFLDSRLPVGGRRSKSKSGNDQPQAWIARGQGIEIHGSGEAYMPLFEALTGLYQQHNHARLAATLSKHAPLWLLQMPSLVSAAKLEALQRATLGATPKRMLREIAEAFEALTVDVPLVLVLEDLHWSDHSTLNFISYLGQRSTPARLLLIGTYRPSEAMSKGHSITTIKQDLQMHRQCQELALELLNEHAVAEYLAARFPGNRFPQGIETWVHRRTEGNPLFMVNLIDHMVGQRSIICEDGYWNLSIGLETADTEVPTTIQEMIENKIKRCSPQEQEILEAGSVEGVEFSASALAAVLDKKVARIEALCEGLAQRRRFLRSESSHKLPDGSLATRFAFIHALYQRTFYQRLPQTRKCELHRRMGEYLERANYRDLNNLAARLAMHFEQGGDCNRAIHYYQLAAEVAVRRFTENEAVQLARQGLRLLELAQNAPEGALQELKLQIALGRALTVIQGFGSEDAKSAFGRAQELCQQSGAMIPLFSAYLGLWRFYGIRGEAARARELGAQLLQLAHVEQDPTMLSEAYGAMGNNVMAQGEFAQGLEHLEKSIVFGNLQERDADRYLYGRDPGISSRCIAALAKWELGYPDQALKIMEEALGLASEMDHPEGYVFAHLFAAHLHRRRREIKRVLKQVEIALTCARQRGLVHWVASGTSVYGWALAKQGFVNEGIEKIRQSLDAQRAIGSEHPQSMVLAMLAEALMDAGQVEEGLFAVEEALAAVHRTGVCNYEAEIYLLKGELLFQKLGIGQALEEIEECLRRSIEIARQQQARSVELRSTMALTRLWQKLGRQDEAHRKLTKIYEWFSEGFDTADLQEAKELLQQLCEQSNASKNNTQLNRAETY